MKKIHVIIMAIAVIGTVSCQNAAENERNQSDTPTEQAEESVEIEITSIKTSGATYSIDDFEVGDKVCGLTLKSLNKPENEACEFLFEGEIEIEGVVYENPMDYVAEFDFEKDYLTVQMNGMDFQLFRCIEISNGQDLQNALNTEELKMYRSGSVVPLKITLKNPSYIIRDADKGRLSFGKAEFVSREE